MNNIIKKYLHIFFQDWRRASIAVGLLLGLVSYVLTRPLLVVEGEGKFLFIQPTGVGEKLSIHFIHSVQKTRVIENHIVNDTNNGFILKSTKYQSFGVGLPFLDSEGKFRQEGDFFIIDDFNRQFNDIILRAGIGTELTLVYRGKEYPVYQDVPVGGRIDIKLKRVYELLW